MRSYAMSAAGHLLDAASIEGKNSFENAKRQRLLENASLEIGKYENPLDGLKETRDVLSTLGSEGNYSPGMIASAKTLAFSAYNKR